MKNKISYIFYLVIDIIILASSFLFFAWRKPGTVAHIIPTYRIPFIWFSCFWIFMSLLGAKYNRFTFGSLAQKVSSILKSNFLILALITISMFVFHTFEFSRSIVLGTIGVSTILELLIAFISSYLPNLKKNYDDSTNISLKASEIYDSNENKQQKDKIDFDLPACDEMTESIKSKLESVFAEYNDKVLAFLKKHIDICKIPKRNAEILNTHTLFNISHFDKGSQSLFINLHKLNDFRRMNVHFIKVNQNLMYGGYFMGCGVTLQENYHRIFNNFPFIISHIVYGTDFLLRRVLPKIPYLKAIYFFLTKGENRAISKAEILGRLYFCGFKILDVTEIDNRLYFLAQKVAVPKEDVSPSYGPLIKMRRVGKDKQLIYVYKFRTMHPYSEYLQQYMYDHFKLEDKGKFKNDFRITAWGKVFRKLWIDELPQFINYFRGELSIFGVRALSLHYFSLYPQDLQDLRTKFKPGLVPPFYVDIPNCFDEILDSERRYLQKRLDKGFTVNIEYFFKAWYNIIFKHARSG